MNGVVNHLGFDRWPSRCILVIVSKFLDEEEFKRVVSEHVARRIFKDVKASRHNRGWE